MRFNVLQCLSFIAILASFSSVSARLSRRRLPELSELSIRNDGSLGSSDELYRRGLSKLSIRDDGSLGEGAAYDRLFRRIKISAVAAATRKAAARAEATKNGKGTTSNFGPKTAKHASTQAAADARKTTKKQNGQAKFGAAAAAHKATTNMPGRKQQFKVPGGGPKFTGKDARKAVFDSHMERQANAGKSKTQLKKSPLKNFGNSNHREPQPNKPHDTKSINHMKGSGHEFPLGDPVNKGPARVITQQTADGHTKFKGVIAHDVSRTAGDLGYNDHFQVKPTGSKRK